MPSRPASFEAVVGIADRYAGMPVVAQRIVRTLADLQPLLADAEARREARAFLGWLADGGGGEVDPVSVERARVVLAAYEGHVDEESGEVTRLGVVESWPGDRP